MSLRTIDTSPHCLKDSNASLKVETLKEEGIRVRFLIRSTLGVEGYVGAPGWGLGQMISGSSIHTNLHKPNNKLVSAWLEHFWCMDEPWAYTDSQNSPQRELGGSHHLPLYSIICASPRGLHPNVILSQGSQFWRLITFCVNLRLKWSHKQSCSPHWELSRYMWHVTCTQVNQGDSWLLMVESQINNLTPGPSFSDNLCFKYSNGTCKLILNIYISRTF